MGELTSWCSNDCLVFFHAWKNGYPGPDGKQQCSLRIWHPKLGVHITLSDRRSVASHLKAIRATGMGFEKLPTTKKIVVVR